LEDSNHTNHQKLHYIHQDLDCHLYPGLNTNFSLFLQLFQICPHKDYDQTSSISIELTYYKILLQIVKEVQHPLQMDGYTLGLDVGSGLC
jgi:hypothetical protein